ncbi:unnamed protein product [Chironomus riparius]|uniref:C2H2-type domain-containing protein n=1 Tax=Chironomus riparius TaxID=315576 RepID=A0A9P0J5B8_9DIPT|nr:unnamed protein product [Chironomus riparius]
MDKKPIVNKTIKTIVPIKGNLLEKIKNKLKHNGSNSATSETQQLVPQKSIDAINNNKQDPVKIQKLVVNKRTSKIEIQKIEKVNLEINDLIKATQSEPVKTGLHTKIREASPKPINRSPLRIIEDEIPELPEIEACFTMPAIRESDIIVQELILNDHPCSSKSMCLNFQPKSTEDKKEEKSLENVSKDDEMINNMSEEEDEGELMDIGDAAWLHDINVMIGKPRIQEIDQSLKKIPTTVTGNRIQTENVELKLIINHLLGKLKAKSVIETVQESSSSFFNNVKDSEVEYSDSFDDMPTDFDDEPSDVDSTKQTEVSTVKTEISVDQNSFSVPVENSVAIITIPTISEIYVKPSTTIEAVKNEVKSSVEINVPVVVEETANINIQPTKKRRGRQPIAASTAKKTKLSPTKSIKEESSPRRYNLRISSSRESSVESNKDASITKSVTLPVRRDSLVTRRNSTMRENVVKPIVEKDAETKIKATNKKVTRVQELKGNKKESSAMLKRSVTSSESSLSSDSEIEKKGRSRPQRKAKIQKESSQKITNFFKAESVIVTETIDATSNIKKSSSENSSNEKSPINGRRMSKTYLKHQPKNEKNVISSHQICADLKDIVDKSKDLDPTYLKPPDTTKRPYLKTSAFKGNHINSDDSSNHTDSSTKQLSVSCDDSSIINNANDTDIKKNGLQNANNLGIKDRMKELIKKQKEKINSVPKSNEVSITIDPVSSQNIIKEEISNKQIKKKKPESENKININQRGPRRKVDVDETIRKIFEQEELEKPIEKLVCYKEILEAIRITDPSRKNGRASSAIKPLELAKKRELEKQLECLKHFKCGNCNNLVTKHKWKEHLIDHGGMAWIETFESPIDIKDWNESVRRLNNYMRIYKLESFRCPNCGYDKKSALGHLSHIYICGESEETIEDRKYACEFCSEKVLPYNMSWHKRKCTVINNKVKTNADDGDDEEEHDDENSRSSSTQDGGRAKRKAGKNAVRKVKSFLKELNEDPMDQILATVNGQFICNHCGEKFDVKEKAIEHLDKAHADQKEGVDFEASSSDASLNENESSETEGSSGVESSDVQSANEVEEPDNEMSESINVSNSKGRKSYNDSQEIKNGRRVIGPYAESYHSVRISTRTIKLTKEFINDNLCDILTEFTPKYKICVSANLASYLMDLKIDTKSMKFTTSLKDDYCLEYGKIPNQEWNQLDFGNCHADKNSLTLFCGGSVSSLDWSQSKDGTDFLAVACNSTKEKNTDLEETSKTFIQVYQFENLVNEKFTSFTNTSKFLYFFTITEGPVWSIKFHPFVVPNNERIGLLAVTSSNHHIYVYSLPYLKNDTDSPKIISLEPAFTCKTVNDVWLFQDKYLMQATVVNWFYRKDCDMQLLGAGFINGMLSIWNFRDVEKSEHQDAIILFPYMSFQPHRESVTALDFKYTLGSDIHLLTTSFDRDVKIFMLENTNFQEISSNYSTSRILCAEWWQNWPGFVTGNDNCYSHGNLVHRQPLEFGSRHNYLFYCVSSVTTLSVNNWLNVAVFTTDSGDVLMSNPSQLMSCHPKDRWMYFGNNVLSYTDIVDLKPNSNKDEHGIVFCDLKARLPKRPKEFRSPPSDNINQLQINQISFNRSEMSYRFYALAYETGFVRIKHLKNSK